MNNQTQPPTLIPSLPDPAPTIPESHKSHRKYSLTHQESVSLWETKLELKYEKLLYKLQDVYIEINQFLEASHDYTVTEQQRQQLRQQKKTLLLRESQIFMVLFLVENRNKPTFEEAYHKSFQTLEKLKIPAELVRERPINFFILEDLFEMEIKYDNEYQRSLRALHEAVKKSEKDFRNALKKCRVMISKISTMIQGFGSACLFPLDDLFSQPLLTSPRWESMRSVMRILVLGDKQRLQESFDSVRNKLVFTTAALNKFKVMKDRGGVASTLKGLYAIFQYAFSKQKAKWRAQLCIANPDGRFMKQMWNLPELKTFRPIVDLIMPRIKYSESIYIQRLVSPITAQRIYKWQQTHDYGVSEQLQIQMLEIDQNPVEIAAQLFTAPSDNDISNERVHIRINSPVELKQRDVTPTLFSRWFGTGTSNVDTIVFHIHGGGFISMSPYIHQTYIRKWANNLKCPFFSIDYRKSPEYAFPQGLDDCFQAYIWMIKYLEKVFDLKMKKIVIVGDSAGANLGMAMINLAIKYQIRVPDALFLIYPALSLEDNRYTPSILKALEDMVLPHTFLKICQKSYLQDERLKAGEDPFISPMYTSDQFLKAYPPVRMYVGSMDPFHDDCCRLTERLLNLKNDIRLTVFDSFPHGFLQFDIPPEGNEFSAIAIQEIEDEIKDVIQKQ